MLGAALAQRARGTRRPAGRRPCSRRSARRSPPRSRRRAPRTAPRPHRASLYGAVSVSCAAPSVTPGRPGQAERREPAPAALGQQRVGVPVVAAVELHEQVAAGGAARQPDGASSRPRCPTRPGAPSRRAAIASTIRLGELDLRLGRHPEAGSASGSRGGRLDDRGVRVPEQQRAPGLHEVDVARRRSTSSIHAPSPRADEHRRAADGPERADRRDRRRRGSRAGRARTGPRSPSRARMLAGR